MDTGSYRIAMSMQWIFALILGLGLFFLPDSPRWYVKRNRLDDAARSLSQLRGQPADSQYVKDELAELVANYKYEMTHMQAGWLDCFRGGWKPSSNLRRVVLGIALQMMQQWTGGKSVALEHPAHTNKISQLHLLLRLHILPDRRYRERLPCLHDHDRCQRRLHATVVLGSREAGPPHPPYLWRRRYADLRVPHWYHRHRGRGQQGRVHMPHRLHVYLHLFLRHYLGSRRLGSHRRDLPATHSCQRRRSVDGQQLVLELHHRLHHSISNEQGVWQP